MSSTVAAAKTTPSRSSSKSKSGKVAPTKIPTKPAPPPPSSPSLSYSSRSVSSSPVSGLQFKACTATTRSPSRIPMSSRNIKAAAAAAATVCRQTTTPSPQSAISSADSTPMSSVDSTPNSSPSSSPNTPSSSRLAAITADNQPSRTTSLEQTIDEHQASPRARPAATHTSSASVDSTRSRASLLPPPILRSRLQYPSWQRAMRALLVREGCWGLIDGTTPTSSPNYPNISTKTSLLLLAALPPASHPHVAHLAPRDLWSHLEKTHTLAPHEACAALSAVQAELSALRPPPDAPGPTEAALNEHLARFSELVDRAEDCGARMKEPDRIGAFLRTLPKALGVHTAVAALPAAERVSWAGVERAYLLQARRVGREAEERQSAAAKEAAEYRMGVGIGADAALASSRNANARKARRVTFSDQPRVDPAEAVPEAPAPTYLIPPRGSSMAARLSRMSMDMSPPPLPTHASPRTSPTLDDTPNLTPKPSSSPVLQETPNLTPNYTPQPSPDLTPTPSLPNLTPLPPRTPRTPRTARPRSPRTKTFPSTTLAVPAPRREPNRNSTYARYEKHRESLLVALDKERERKRGSVVNEKPSPVVRVRPAQSSPQPRARGSAVASEWDSSDSEYEEDDKDSGDAAVPAAPLAEVPVAGSTRRGSPTVVDVRVGRVSAVPSMGRWSEEVARKKTSEYVARDAGGLWKRAFRGQYVAHSSAGAAKEGVFGAFKKNRA